MEYIVLILIVFIIWILASNIDYVQDDEDENDTTK